jgi:hypothetical protein
MKRRTLTMCVGQMLPAKMNIEHPALQSKLSALEKLLNYLEAHAPYEEQPQGMAQALARASLFRARNVLRAAYAVAKLKLPTEVLALARVLCEATIHMQWVTKGANRDERAQTLIDEAFIKGFKAVDAHLKHNPSIKDKITPQEWHNKRTELEVARRRLGLKPNENYREQSIAERARQSGREVEQLYDLFYREMCIHAHASVKSFQDALDEPDAPALDKALFLTNVSALDLLRSCGSILNLPDTSTLESEIASILQHSGNAVVW